MAGCVTRDRVLLAFALASMAMASLWGVFGAMRLLFAIDELGLGAAAIGVIAGFGGLSSLVGAAIAERTARRFGIGPAAIASMIVASIGFALIPLAPAGLPVVAFAFLVGQQLIGDGAVTLYHVTETSVRQARVPDRALGRVAATMQVTSRNQGAQLAAALVAGLLAEAVGLRAVAAIGPLGTLIGAASSSPRRCGSSARSLPRRPRDSRWSNRAGDEARPGRTAADRRPARRRPRSAPARPTAARWRRRCHLGVESSLVRTMPVRPAASWNAAWARPFWPVVASSTNNVSGRAPGRRLSMMRRTFVVHQGSPSCGGGRPCRR